MQCTGSGTYSFLGVTQGSDVAAGYESAVAGGNGNQACDDWSTVGGGVDNNVGSGADAAKRSFIGGGLQNAVTQTDAFIGAGEDNVASYTEAFVGAGSSNMATNYGSFVGGGDSNMSAGQYSFVGGGASNETTIDASFVGAGYNNEASGYGSFVGAGDFAFENSGSSGFGNQASGNDSFIGAGDANVVKGSEAFVGSGQSNAIGANATYAVVTGGGRNNATAQYASILGGFGNLASGSYAVVAGGDADSAAGTLSFAAGYHATATHNGSFVWSDYTSGSKSVADGAANEFVARASGGVYLYSNEATTSGVKLAAGSGTWESLSDRNAKSGIVPLDGATVLAKLSSLPIATWQYTSENGVRHAGPMAQDFYAAFGVGEDDRHITSIDEDGVALAAIKGLDAKVRTKDDEIAMLHVSLAGLQSRFSSLEARNAALEARVDTLARFMKH